MIPFKKRIIQVQTKKPKAQKFAPATAKNFYASSHYLSANQYILKPLQNSYTITGKQIYIVCNGIPFNEQSYLDFSQAGPIMLQSGVRSWAFHWYVPINKMYSAIHAVNLIKKQYRRYNETMEKKKDSKWNGSFHNIVMESPPPKIDIDGVKTLLNRFGLKLSNGRLQLSSPDDDAFQNDFQITTTEIKLLDFYNKLPEPHSIPLRFLNLLAFVKNFELFNDLEPEVEKRLERIGVHLDTTPYNTSPRVPLNGGIDTSHAGINKDYQVHVDKEEPHEFSPSATSPTPDPAMQHFSQRQMEQQQQQPTKTQSVEEQQQILKLLNDVPGDEIQTSESENGKWYILPKGRGTLVHNARDGFRFYHTETDKIGEIASIGDISELLSEK